MNLNGPPMADDSPSYLNHRQRLKRKFIEAGIGALHDYEIIELLLSYAIPRKDVKPLAKNLIQTFGSIRKIMDADVQDIENVKGMGHHAAVLIKLVRDSSSIYLREKAAESPQITCTAELINYYRNTMGGLKDEHFHVIYLNARNKIIEMETIHRGIVNQAVVYPRKILEQALKKKASAIILVHNHPSGHVQPSDADIRLTRTVQETAKALDIMVHDHIIIGENRFYSFREEGIIR
jgi:DNA repair protein RadC